MKRTAEDRRWSRAVRERDDFTCQRCGKKYPENSTGLHAAHIFSRGIKRTRCELDNGLSACYGCHRVIDAYPDEKERLARAALGDVAYEALRERAHSPRKRAPVGAR